VYTFIHHEGSTVYIQEMNYEESMNDRKLLLNVRDRQADITYEILTVFSSLIRIE